MILPTSEINKKQRMIFLLLVNKTMRSDFKWLVCSTDSGSRPFFAYKTILMLSSDCTGIPSVGYLLFFTSYTKRCKVRGAKYNI